MFFSLFSVNYKKHNDSKNVFAFSRTPTAFISAMVIFYLIAGLLDMIWLSGLNFIFMFGFWVCFILLGLWLYTKYSGDYSEIGEYIDHFADIIWNNVSSSIRIQLCSFFSCWNNLFFCLTGVSTILCDMSSLSDAFSFGSCQRRLKDGPSLMFIFFYFFSLLFLLIFLYFKQLMVWTFIFFQVCAFFFSTIIKICA